jgi:hypothetical protein
MQAVLVLFALSLPGQVEAQPAGPNPANPSQAEAAKADPSPMEEQPRVFTLDEIAAGAKNDAFVDEFLKGQPLSLFGPVQRIERSPQGTDGEQEPASKGPTGYRLIMFRVGHEDHPIDVEVFFVFAEKARKELALLEPGASKVTIQGTCNRTQLQPQQKGYRFSLELQDCQIVETPADLDSAQPTRPAIIPNVVPDNAPPAPAPNPAP